MFGTDKFILQSGLTFKAEGVGLITRPDAIVAKSVDQLLEATSEIVAKESQVFSLKPQEQLLETSLDTEFFFRGVATKVDSET